MATMTISLPDKIARKVDSEAKKGGFATRSEFVRSLLRQHLQPDPEPIEFEPFVKVPLAQVRKEFEATGKYNKKFIDGLIRGLKNSSVYKNDK